MKPSAFGAVFTTREAAFPTGTQSRDWLAGMWRPQLSFTAIELGCALRLFRCGSRTFGQGLDSDDLTAVASSGWRHRHHPDTILPIPTQVRNSVGKRVRGGFELADDLWEGTDMFLYSRKQALQWLPERMATNILPVLLGEASTTRHPLKGWIFNVNCNWNI